MDKLIIKTIPVFKKYGVLRASLFGSTIRGDSNKKSDIDLLISPAKGTTLFDMVAIKNDLEAVLEKPVDLLTYNGLNPLLKNQILKQQEIIYEKRSTFIQRGNRKTALIF